MSDLEHTLKLIKSEDHLLDNLNQLGTILRDASIRECDEVVQFIPKLVSLYINSDDESLILELQRVLINLMADSDNNRLELIKYNDFWDKIKKDLCLVDRTFILINQFVKNTQALNQFIKFFYDLDMHGSFFEYLHQWHNDNTSLIVEFLLEVLIPDIILHDEAFKSRVLPYMNILVTVYNDADVMADEDDDEINEYYKGLSLILYNLTLFQDIPGVNSTNINEQICDLIDRQPEVSNMSTVKRQLFSTIGNITSMANYDNISDVKFAVDRLSKASDLYVKASCYIIIGNYINTQEKSDAVKSLIQVDQFVSDFFCTRFNDVIQFQAIHVMKNVLNTNTANLILESCYLDLLAFTKIIVDNKDYYKEIHAVYISFINKLIRYRAGNVYSFKDLWLLLDNEDVFIQLSEFYEPNDDHDDHNNDLNQKILSSLFTADLPLDSMKLLNKIKYQSIFLNKNRLVINSIFVGDFLNHFLTQYSKLYDLISNSKSDNPQYAILLNNSKFISVSLLGSSINDPQVETIAKSIIAIESNPGTN